MIVNHEDLARTPTVLAMRNGNVATFVDDDGNEFHVVKIAIDTYWVL